MSVVGLNLHGIILPLALPLRPPYTPTPSLSLEGSLCIGCAASLTLARTLLPPTSSLFIHVRLSRTNFLEMYPRAAF